MLLDYLTDPGYESKEKMPKRCTRSIFPLNIKARPAHKLDTHTHTPGFL